MIFELQFYLEIVGNSCILNCDRIVNREKKIKLKKKFNDYFLFILYLIKFFVILFYQ